MMQPKRLKYRKPFIGKVKKRSFIQDKLYFGEFGLVSVQNGFLDAKEIEAARRAIVGSVKRKGRLWIRIFSDLPITRKPEQVKMGSGKGDIVTYVAAITKGKILFELGGVPEDDAKKALLGAAYKLSLKVKFFTIK